MDCMEWLASDSTAIPVLQNRGLGVRVPPLLPATALIFIELRFGIVSPEERFATLLLPFLWLCVP
jgi:hypothetical protein